MHSRFQYMYDAAPSVALRARGAAPLAADGADAPLALDTLTGYWTDGELADKTLAVVINVDALTVDADLDYVVNVQVAADEAFTAPVTVASLSQVPATGQYVLLLDMDTVSKVAPGALFIRTATDITDGAGAAVASIDFYAWLSGIQK